MQELIRQLPYSQIVEFCNMPSYLFFSEEETVADSTLLLSLVQYVGGHKTWDDILQSQKGEKSIIEIFRTVVEARTFGYLFSGESVQFLDDIWKDESLKFENKKELIQEKLNGITEETQEAYIYAQEILDEVNSFDIRDSFPQSFEDIEVLQRDLFLLSRCQSDSEDILSIAEDEFSINTENLLHFSEKSFFRLFPIVTQGSLLDNSHQIKMFKQLPNMILNKQTSILKRIADEDVVLEDIEIVEEPLSTVRKFRASRASRRMAKISPNITASTFGEELDHKLSAYSSSIYNSALALETCLVTHSDLEMLRRKAENFIGYDQKSSFWFGVAKSCSDNTLKNVALGEGLLATGINLIIKGQFVNARPTLVDAFVNLVNSGNLGLESIERCGFALLTSVIWPQAVTRDITKSDGIIWVNQPDLLFDILRGGIFLDLVGKIWVTYLPVDVVAESFLNLVSVHFGDDKTLFKGLCGYLSTSHQILSDCDLVVRRVHRLLYDASPPDGLLKLMQKVSDEIPREAISNIEIVNGYSLKKVAQELKLHIEKLPRDNVAPVNEIKLLFFEVLENIIRKSSLVGHGLTEPNLTIEPMVTKFYPEEQADDLEFPILVRNSINAGFASDVVLVISCHEDGQYCPIIEKNELEFGDLHPGQVKEKLFFIDIPEQIVNKRTELKLEFQLRLGNVVLKKKRKVIVVKIRPSSQRLHKSSPYTPGGVVIGTNFIGREKEISHIKNTLTGDSDQKVLLLYGMRRIGKTSIVKNIQEDLEVTKLYYPIFWDVEDLGEDISTSIFVQMLIEKIRNALPSQVKVKLPFCRKEIKERPLYVMDNFLQSLSRSDCPKRILLIIDEVDNLLHLASCSVDKDVDCKEGFSTEVIAALRKSTMVNKNIHIIFVGLPDLVEQEYQSRLFGLADDIQVTALSENESIKIINAGKSIMKINKYIQDKLLSISGLQPYLLQVLCHKLFNKMQNSGRDMVADFDLNDIIEKIAANESLFTDYNSLMKGNWNILYGLALAQKDALRSRKYVASLEIEEALARKGLEYSTDEIETALNSYLVGVTKRPLVNRDPTNYRRFSLVVGLIGEFLIRKGRSL